MKGWLKTLAIIGIVWGTLGVLGSLGEEPSTWTSFGIIGMFCWILLGVFALLYVGDAEKKMAEKKKEEKKEDN